MVVAASNNRGKFGKFFHQDVNKVEVDDILYKSNSEIKQFRMDLTRAIEVSLYSTCVSLSAAGLFHQ